MCYSEIKFRVFRHQKKTYSPKIASTNFSHNDVAKQMQSVLIILQILCTISTYLQKRIYRFMKENKRKS